MSHPWWRKTVCLLLSLVVLATSTAGSLRHAHEEGDRPHHRSLAAAPAGSARVHRHVHLLGLEVYQDDCQGDGRPLEQITAGISLDARGPQRDLPAAPTPVPCPLTAAFPAETPPLLLPSVGVSPPFCCSLPVLATHTRTGVLSI